MTVADVWQADRPEDRALRRHARAAEGLGQGVEVAAELVVVGADERVGEQQDRREQAGVLLDVGHRGTGRLGDDGVRAAEQGPVRGAVQDPVAELVGDGEAPAPGRRTRLGGADPDLALVDEQQPREGAAPPCFCPRRWQLPVPQ